MKFRLIIFFTCFSVSTMYSQKSAPVAGDAAQLIDLLKKDYNSISPDARADELIKDRAKVAAIFRSYVYGELDDTFSESNLTTKNYITDSNDEILNLTNLTYANISQHSINYESSLKDYERQKQEIQDIKNLNLATNNATFTKIENRLANLNDTKSKFYDNSYYKSIKDLIVLHLNYESNNYLSYCIELFIKKYSSIQESKLDGFASQNYQSSVQKSLPFLGGDLALETLIDGLSRFLAQRIKDELTTYVVERIQNNLNNPKPTSYLNELMILMPVTTNYVRGFEADQVLNFVDELKQYIEEDFNNLMENAHQLKNTARFKELLTKHPDLDFAFEALEIYPKISKIKNPIDYFDLLDTSRNISRWSRIDESDEAKFNLANAIHLSSLLAHSLTVSDQSEIRFVSTDFMSNYGSELNFYLLYVGFLNQQNLKYYNIKFYDSASNKVDLKLNALMSKIDATTLDATKRKATFLFEELSQITAFAEKIHNDALAIKKAKNNNEKVDIKDIHALIDGILHMAESIVVTGDNILTDSSEFVDINIGLKKSLKAYTQSYFKVANTSNDIVLDLHTKKYSSAIMKAIEIPDYLIEGGFNMNAIYKIQQVTRNAEELLAIKNALMKEKIPSKENQRQVHEGNLLILKATLQRMNNTTLNPIIADLDQAINLVKSKGSNNAYADIRNKIIKQFLDHSAISITEFTNYNINENIITPLTNYLNSNINDPVVSAKILEITNNYIKTLFEKAITIEALDLDILLEDDDFKKSNRELNQYVTAYMPELLVGAFKIKDQNLIKIVHFINDIAISESDEDVEAAINAFALPSGSYSLKRKQGDYVSINAFPGILSGFEQRSLSDMKLNTIAFTAPIGIYTKISNKANIGLFIPVIDLAAPVRFRLDESNATKTLPEFNFKNIIAPGLYITYSPFNAPLTFNIGAQYGPELQLVEVALDMATGETTTNTKLFDDSFRIGIGITLDIPLFTIYNRPNNQ